MYSAQEYERLAETYGAALHGIRALALSRDDQRVIAAALRIASMQDEIVAVLRLFVVPRDGKHSGALTDDSPVFSIDDHLITVGAFRRARALLSKLTGSEKEGGGER